MKKPIFSGEFDGAAFVRDAAFIAGLVMAGVGIWIEFGMAWSLMAIGALLLVLTLVGPKQ